MRVNKDFVNENGKLKCDCAFIDCQCINEIKKQVAREIFEEIAEIKAQGNSIAEYWTDWFDKLNELKKKYIGE